MLEKITTDLETSKKLKELGFKAETKFYWTITSIDKWNKNEWNLVYFKDIPMAKYEPTIPVYTLEQIINELPKYFNFKRLCYYFSINYSDDALEYKYESDDMYQSDRTLFFTLINKNNLATTAAKLWIKLKEDKII